MHRRNTAYIRVLAALSLTGVSLSAAAVDVVPFIGSRFGGDINNNNNYNYYYAQPSLTIDSNTSYGGIIDFPIERGPQAVELYYSHQPTSIHLDNYYSSAPPYSLPGEGLSVNVAQIGLIYSLPTPEPKLQWMVDGLLGATQFVAAYDSTTKFSTGVGLGLRFMANPNVGVRADIRGLVTFLNGDSTIYCNGGCTGHFNSTAMVQGEASLGLVVRF